jgi:hypothetical protein
VKLRLTVRVGTGTMTVNQYTDNRKTLNNNPPPSIAYERMIKNACLRTGNNVFYFTETNNIQFTLRTVYVVQHMYILLHELTL